MLRLINKRTDSLHAGSITEWKCLDSYFLTKICD